MTHAAHFPPVFDGHNDVLWAIYLAGRSSRHSFFVRSQKGHIDLPRAREGGLAGGFFAVFVPSLKRHPVVSHARALRSTEAAIQGLFRLEKASRGRVRVVRDMKELSRSIQRDALAMVLHFEGAEAIDPRLKNLEMFYGQGLRSLGLVWSRPNAFGHGVPFRHSSSPDTGPGLTLRGKELVRACQGLGMIVDMAHLNEKGFWDVEKISKTPLVVTHAGVHALCPSSRNLTDQQLKAIKESGGVVGIAFHVGFLRWDGRNDIHTPLSTIVRHVDYVANLIGIDHVAFGSDFDGALMPETLKDVAGLPKLLQAFRDRGYDAQALKKLTHGNWFRVIRKTWKR